MPRQLRPRSAPIAKAKASAPAEWLHLDRQLCFALYSSSLAMTKLYKPLLEPLGLTYPQYLALLVLWERDGLGVNELGERLFLDSGTLTPLLKRMEAAGWVQRERDRADERRVVVSLTAEGRALRKQAQNVPPQVARASGCSAPELAELTLRLQRLRDQLLAPSGNPSPTDAAPPASAH
jgi:MarR family transcriptional regulator, organic hydroperoxide resistance regulator